MEISKKYFGAEVRHKIAFRVRAALLFTHWTIQLKNFFLFFFRKALFRKINSPRQILVFRTGSIGDSICAIPSIISIGKTFPGASIDILTNAGRKNLVGLHYLLAPEYYRAIIDYNGLSKRQLFNLLIKKKYDLVVQLPQVDASFVSLLRDMIVFRAIAPSGIGWFVSQSKWFRQLQSKHLIFPNENQRLLSYLNKKKFATEGIQIKLNIQQQDVELINALFVKENITPIDKKLCIVIGAKRPQNRWPIEYFKTVAEYFVSKYKIILIGAEEDNLLAQPLMRISDVVNFCGKLTPMQSAVVLSLCDLTLSNDTGPMHMSYAVNTPTIALFSCRDLPGKWYPPLTKNNIVFRTEAVECEACFSETCNNNICMKAILPEKIIQIINDHFVFSAKAI